MVTAALGLHPVWSQLIPIAVFEAIIAVGFHGSHVQTLSHVDRLLLFNCRGAAKGFLLGAISLTASVDSKRPGPIDLSWTVVCCAHYF